MVCKKNEMEKSSTNDFGIGGKILIQEADDDIHISGIAGDFPDAEGLTEFAEKLFNKVDLISDDDRRWKLEHPEIPQRTGKLKQVNKFDAASFGIHYNQAQSMDPMTRILLEKSYEAIIDSGYNPYSLRGSRTGVFIGACFSESEKTWFYEKLQVDGFGVTGCIRTMLANRISYAFGFDGPSYVVDTACSSSMYALEQGYNSIREGHCDAAIVGGCNLCLHPYVSLQFARLGVLSLDGRCKVFDEAANGYCRSEAIAVVFLQKKKDCRRIYANVVHVKTNCDGYKEQGITYPSGEMQQRLLEEFYEECTIDPASLAWVEAHGTGTKVGDPEEVRALYNVFCKNRKTPLQIGSVKSNLGHTEPSSGMCSIAKVIIAMETGLIPPNINFTTPRSDIEYFHTGEIQVITEPTPWNGGMVGVNSFGFGGANCHALLKWNEKSKKNGGCPEDDIPRLVNVSGRTVEAVDTMLKFLEKMNLDAELIKLFHDIHKDEIPSHLYRGFTILTKNKSVNIRDIQYCGMKKPLYLLFSSQYYNWKSFDKSLLEFPAFSQSLSRMSKAISIDISQLITNPDISMTDPINFFISTIASQIAFYDLLQFIGVVPHAVIGVSLGGLVCAYIDGYLSIEEAIIIAYNLASIFTTSSVLTESVDGMHGYKTKNANNLFETEIPRNAMCNATDNFLKSSKSKIIETLDMILKNIEPYESKWLNVYGKIKQLGGSEFIYQNIISNPDVTIMNNQFPEDSMLLNIGPKGIYKELDLDFPVHNMLNSDGVEDTTSFLTCIGKLYLEGVESNISKLYMEVDYPVSRSTPMIAPLVRWNHTHDWYVTSYRLEKKIGSGERTTTISLSEDENEYISGHVIDGRNLFPATGYLSLVWETVGLIKGEHYTEVPVVFEDVRFLRATNMSKDGSVNFTIIVQRASGNFEVVEGGAPIVTGRVYVPNDVTKEVSLIEAPIVCNKECTMSSKDIYKELRLRGYNYKGLFKSLVGINVEENVGIIRWQKNWVAFMDNMLQIQILHEDTRGLFVPTSIEKVVIDGRKHVQSILSLPEEEEKDLAVYMYKEAQLIKSGGVEIRGLRANPIARRKNLSDPILERNLFIPNISETQIYSLEEIVRIFAQIIIENENVINVRVVELHDKAHAMLAPIIAGVLSDLPLIQPDILVFGTPEITENEPLPPEIVIEDKKINNDQTALLVSANNILNESQSSVLESCLNALKPGGYLITRELIETDVQNAKVTTLCSHIFNNERVMLLRKNKKVENERTTYFNVDQEDLSWLTPSQNALKSKECKRVVFVGMDGETNGALGLVNCLRKEPEGQKARCFLVMDDNVPAFSLEEKLYKTQLSKDLAINVYKNGEWGTYRHLKLNSNNKVKAAHVYANSLVRGDLSSLSWIKGPISDEMCFKPCDNTLINIHYASLNFRDVMLASGKLVAEVVTKKRLDQQCFIGFEFSGVSHDGSRYMGMINSKALASVIKCDSNLTWKVPDSWTLEDAATIPCTYGTALFSLVIRGKMKKGDSVLIHAGSGGVGQAAIHCALAHDCEVFTTVGTPEKRKFIKETFPQIKDSHIGNSRDTSFEQMVMKETNGRGVDIVLNSLAEEKLLASVRCLAKGGRFLEIGKFDLSNNNPLSMEVFARGASFYGILLDAFFDAEPEAKSIISSLINTHVANHTIKPLCRHVFKCDELETAFRFMSSGKHIGKVLIKMRDVQDEHISNSPTLFDAVPRFYCDPEKSYIIIGGLGGFGLELADWLVLRGATKLVLTSRKGLTNGYQSYRINLWKSYGVDVEVLTDDVVTPKGVENILNVASSKGPVSTIFNLAVVLKDGLYENQTEESFQISLGPKALATKYLDQKSRKLCPKLDHFIVFSSVSCGRGNAAQTNYGMANSIMERICEKRVSEGLPGTAVQWGAVGDVGIVADMMDDNIELVIGGTLPQRITSCMEIMDHFLTQNHPIVASMVVAEKKSGHSSSDNIVDTVVNILGIRDLKTVSFHSNLAELGMDSMMAVEIKQTLEREFEVYLSPQDIRGMTIAKLQELASAKESSEDKPPESNEQEPEAVTEPGFEKYLIQMIAPEPEKYEPIVKLNSLGVQNIGSEVFMIPGIEGFPIVFEHIVKQLDYELYGLQFDYTTNHNKISDIAEFFLSKMLPYIKKKTFNIVGYSYGGLIGIDLVRRLENLGFNGKLILIDSTPEMMTSFAKNTFSDEIDENLEVQTILRFLDNAIVANRKTEIETLLREAPDWDSRLELITNLAKNIISFSTFFMKQLFNSGLNRVISVLKHEGFPEKCISAPVTLIRPTEAVCPGDEDYGLSKHCLRPVSIHFVEGNHLTVLTNSRTATIISEVLSSQERDISKTSLINPPTEITKLNDPSKQL